MADVIVSINKKTLKLRFGLGVFKKLGEKWQLPTLMKVQNHVLVTLSDMTEDVSFAQLDVMNDLIVAAVECHDDNIETVSVSELEDMYLADTKNLISIISIVMKEFTKALPQPKKVPELGKLKAPAKQAKN
jgi:hypothetical protein